MKFIAVYNTHAPSRTKLLVALMCLYMFTSMEQFVFGELLFGSGYRVRLLGEPETGDMQTTVNANRIPWRWGGRRT